MFLEGDLGNRFKWLKIEKRFIRNSKRKREERGRGEEKERERQ